VHSCHHYALTMEDAICRIKRKCWLHMKQSSLRGPFGICCMMNICILYMYNLYRGYSHGTTIFASSSYGDFYTKLQMNLAFVALLWTAEATFTKSRVNNLHSLHKWSLENLMPVNKPHFNKDLASMFGPELQSVIQLDHT
jgi:hypothetical protein